MIRVLDICSGYSASTLAWAGLGFKHVGYSEIEAFPRAILEQRHGAVPVDWDHRYAPGSNITPLFGDFTKIEEHHVGPVDVLTGGTPCQAFSVAGKRLGLDDPRGNLTLEFLALAKRLRVEWLAWENVPGFLSHDDGRTMGTFLGLLGELGYGWAYRVLDAQYIRVDGLERAVPQRRKRLVLVGHLGDATGPAAVLFERESLRGDPAPRRRSIQDVARRLASGSQRGSGYRNDADTAENLIPQGFGGGNCSGPIDAAACLTAKGQRIDFEVETFVAEIAATLPAGGNSTGGDRQPGTGAETAGTMLVAHSLRAEGYDASEDGTGRETPLVPICIHSDAIGRTGEAVTPSIDAAGISRLRDPGMGISEGATFGLTTGQPHAVAYSIMPQNSGKDYKAREVDVAQPLMAGGPVGGNQGGDSIAQPIAFAQNQRDEIRTMLVAGALAAEPGMKQQTYIAHQWAVRRLTPTECERLMGVPDDFTLITYRGKPAADGPRYKALGNSQARNWMRWIGHGLADVIRAQSSPTLPAEIATLDRKVMG
jgi:DNA (cytosine-5)-methyltransferase 1